jgi:hypothetical protein
MNRRTQTRPSNANCRLERLAPGPTPSLRLRRIVVGPRGFGRAAELLKRDPRLEACLVESNWDRVDAARARAAAAGLDDRLTVHHACALRFARAC